MIRKKSELFKLFFMNKTSKELYEKRIKHFHAELEVCDNCHVKGKCVNLDQYDRDCVDFIKGKPTGSTVPVQRVICKNCGASHAILYDFIIPYKQHGLYFILKVLAYYFSGLYTVEKICITFDISVQTLYNWKKLYCENKALWLGVLEDSEVSSFEFAVRLIRLDTYSSFGEDFVKLTTKSFLQRHCNPPPRKFRAEHV